MAASRNLRRNRKGGALAAAMLFMIMVTVAGTALLSMSLITRTTMVKNGIDVRLMIAAESGVETLRGRFTLIDGVQDDWSWLSTASWTNVGTPTINGTPVSVDALSIGGASVPTARVRASAAASGRTRFVEYVIRVASFSDYALFSGGAGTSFYGTNYKQVGNVYNNGIIQISPTTGVQFFGRTTTTMNVVYGPEGVAYNFPQQLPLEWQPVVTVPPLYNWTTLETVAGVVNAGNTHRYGENTLWIEFLGTTYRRHFVRRNNTSAPTVAAANANRPTGTGWLNTATGAFVGAAPVGGVSLNNTDYSYATETIAIPDEGVIYVATGSSASNYGDELNNRDTAAGSAAAVDNLFVQTPINVADCRRYNGTNVPMLMVSGLLDSRRVTVVCEHLVTIKGNISYQALLNNPELRRFENKQSPAATGYKEMLGVMSMMDINPAVHWWAPVAAAYNVNNLGGEFVPPHYANQYHCDGVFLGLTNAMPHNPYGAQDLDEWWLCGGLIGAQGRAAAGLGNTFKRRNYDWDWRMQTTMPPYFLRAYNTSAVFVPGTWRTYET
ncbi:MAG: hypothetical protein IPP14_02745 [Planctomycetes bacterium]|nr:hypothetical protein [Planctomycetota bacterium]